MESKTVEKGAKMLLGRCHRRRNFGDTSCRPILPSELLHNGLSRASARHQQLVSWLSDSSVPTCYGPMTPHKPIGGDNIHAHPAVIMARDPTHWAQMYDKSIGRLETEIVLTLRNQSQHLGTRAVDSKFSESTFRISDVDSEKSESTAVDSEKLESTPEHLEC